MFSVVSHGNDLRSVSLDQRHVSIASRIRAPGGVFTVSIEDPVSEKIVYLAVNAAPHGVQGKELVRWRGTPTTTTTTSLRITLWRQRETLKDPMKPEVLSTFTKQHALRKIDAFDCHVKKS